MQIDVKCQPHGANWWISVSCPPGADSRYYADVHSFVRMSGRSPDHTRVEDWKRVIDRPAGRSRIAREIVRLLRWFIGNNVLGFHNMTEMIVDEEVFLYWNWICCVCPTWVTNMSDILDLWINNTNIELKIKSYSLLLFGVAWTFNSHL